MCTRVESKLDTREGVSTQPAVRVGSSEGEGKVQEGRGDHIPCRNSGAGIQRKEVGKTANCVANDTREVVRPRSVFEVGKSANPGVTFEQDQFGITVVIKVDGEVAIHHGLIRINVRVDDLCVRFNGNEAQCTAGSSGVPKGVLDKRIERGRSIRARHGEVGG